MKETTPVRFIKKAFSIGSLVAPNLTAQQAFRLFVTPRRYDRPAWETENLKTGRKFTLKNGLTAYSWGKGPKILLVHGWDGRGTQMSQLAVGLAAQGFEAIAIDLPAHGESPGDRTHVIAAGRAVLSTEEELGPFHAVVAHSFGGGAAYYALYQGLRTPRVVTIASANKFTGVLDRFCDYFRIVGAARVRLYSLLEEWVGMDPYEHYPSNWITKVDSVQGLILHDPSDVEVPVSDGYEISSAWKNSRFIRLTGVGHRRILKSPVTLEHILEFVKPVTASSESRREESSQKAFA